MAAAGGPEMAQLPAVHIVEQPSSVPRFRYPSEGRFAGSIPGVNSTPYNRTYPTIRITGFHGQATIVVSCVSKDEPYKPHPHSLVGQGCQHGVYTVEMSVSAEATDYQFTNLGIQRVKHQDIAKALQQRAELRINPFRTGFDHGNSLTSINLNAVRLAFQVFLHEEGSTRRYRLPPVVSDVIYDKKVMADLLIKYASACSGPVTGGTQIALFCEKVTKDTVVMFYQEDASGRVVWEAVADIVLEHKQVAIVIETPAYPHAHRGQIHVHFRLKRTSDNQLSDPRDFEYIPTQDPKKTRKALFAELVDGYFHEPSNKQEPNRASPDDLYSQPGPSHAESPMAPLHAVPEGHSLLHTGPGGHSLLHAGPEGHSSFQAVPGSYSPLQGGPGGPALSPELAAGLHYAGPVHQPPPPYRLNQELVGGEHMDTDTSLSALLDQVGPLPENHELSSLPDLDLENLSDSLRQLSTDELFPQS